MIARIGSWARIQTGVHAHDVNAGLLLAGHDRPLDWSGAAPTRQ